MSLFFHKFLHSADVEGQEPCFAKKDLKQLLQFLAPGSVGLLLLLSVFCLFVVF